jgi:hypothetical protein
MKQILHISHLIFTFQRIIELALHQKCPAYSITNRLHLPNFLLICTFKWGSTKIKRKTEKKTPYVIIQYLGIMIHYDLVDCPCLYCHSLCVVYLVRIDFVHFFDCLFIFVMPFKIKCIDYFNRFDPATFCVPFPSQ